MALKIPRNEALRSVPQPARSAMAFGACTNAARLKSSIGTKCSAPYIGSVHRKTAKKRSIGLNAQLATCGCEAAHGPYGGCVARQRSSTVMFAGCRSLAWRMGQRRVSRVGKGTYGASDDFLEVL